MKFGEPIESWTDFYGAIVKVGDELLIWTLYGIRHEKVLAIHKDPKPSFERDKDAVIFTITPLVIQGFEDVFKPVHHIESCSTWNPAKWIGRKRTAAEARRAVNAFVKRLKEKVA